MVYTQLHSVNYFVVTLYIVSFCTLFLAYTIPFCKLCYTLYISQHNVLYALPNLLYSPLFYCIYSLYFFKLFLTVLSYRKRTSASDRICFRSLRDGQCWRASPIPLTFPLCSIFSNGCSSIWTRAEANER